jgi:rhodanese-related sulfurtransferase
MTSFSVPKSRIGGARWLCLFLATLATLSLQALGSQELPSTCTAEQVHDWLVSATPPFVIDVRTPDEFHPDHLPAAINLPLTALSPDRIKGLGIPKDVVIVVYCASGKRSARALRLLRDWGWPKVFDLGSISSWPYGTVGEPGY